jgi:hypothetical protein
MVSEEEVLHGLGGRSGLRIILTYDKSICTKHSYFHITYLHHAIV